MRLDFMVKRIGPGKARVIFGAPWCFGVDSRALRSIASRAPVFWAGKKGPPRSGAPV